MAWRLSLVTSLLVALGVAYFAVGLPKFTDLIDGRAKGSVTLLDRHGKVFAWRGDQFGGIVTAESVSPFLKSAIIATEDKRFYRHFGISPRGVGSAIRINIRSGRGPLSGNGGSTITQQTAKLICLGQPYSIKVWKSEREYERSCRRTTLWRKVKEATFAIAMEARYSKDEILTIYLNRAFLGAGARGFEAAAQRYFGKSATQVNPAEAAMLAGLLKAPSKLAPTDNLSGARARAEIVIQLMNQQNYLNKAEANFAIMTPASLSSAATARAGGYFADWVMASGPIFFTRETTEDVIIQTTFDQDIQKATEAAVRRTFKNKIDDKSKAQVAVVVMSADGAVRAMIGGRNTNITGAFNRATQAKRQTGSAFKPFVYATALDLGYTPFDIVRDEPVTYNIPGSGEWSPGNYNDGFSGDVTFTYALAESLNIPAIKISEHVGRELVRKTANDFGITSELAIGPALALGASESTLIEMTGAYAGILNGGSSVLPYGLEQLSLLGETTPLIGRTGGIGERVISNEAAKALTFMMHQVVQTGTGQRAKIQNIEVAGKTGTTQSFRDAWFIGFTADFVIGIWIGNDDNTPLKGVTGGTIPAEIWYETMDFIVNQSQPGPLPMMREKPKTINSLELVKKKQNSLMENRILGAIWHALMGKD
ncbi:PBP1A family penicillin-binding protein [Planktomarina sp.]|nr:PBP1A family penicillin-binding protein [Planktomarina sp.]